MPPRALEDIARLVDAAVSSPGLVFGSLPPTARDLDLLLRPADHRAAAAGLADSGFERHGESWARFADCSATVVDLVPTHEWALPCAEEEALFAEALPLEGCRRLVRPAPHHAVLILARRLVRSRGGLDARRRERAERAVAEDADVWRRARRHAPAWGATRALALLERVVGGGGKPAYRERADALREELHTAGVRLAGARAWKAAAPRLPRGGGVALSGLDGAGKSTQAESLRTTLEALGREAVVVWRPLGQSPVLNLIAKPVKRVLSVLRFGAFAAVAERSATGSVMAARNGSEGSRAGSATRMAWTTIVALVNAASLRGATVRHLPRGRIVIYDRHVLDSIVRLRAIYGPSHRFRLQLLLLRLLAPRARSRFLLDLDPEGSVVRKDDRWSLDELRLHADLYRSESDRLGVRVLDADRPRDELCAEIAREVWRELS